MIKYTTFANKERAILRERMIVWIGSMRNVQTELNDVTHGSTIRDA